MQHKQPHACKFSLHYQYYFKAKSCRNNTTASQFVIADIVEDDQFSLSTGIPIVFNYELQSQLGAEINFCLHIWLM